MATLIAQTPGGPAALKLLPGINTLGRSEGNHLVLAHPSVSSRHCELVVTEEGIRVRDVGSTNGTFIDGHPVAEGAVTHGQRIRFGSLDFLCDAPELAPQGRGPLRVNLPPSALHAEAPPPVAPGPPAPAPLPVAVRPRPDGFFRALPAAFVYPFRRNGLLLFVIGAAVFLLLEFLAGYSWILTIISTGYLFAYMQKIIAHSAQGEDELPDFPEFGDWWSDILLPFLLFAGTFAVSMAPAILALVLGRNHLEETTLWLVVGAAGLAGAVYFPMALLAVAVSDNFLALSPHIVVPSMLRVAGPFAGVLVVLGCLTAVRVGAELACVELERPVMTGVLLGFLSLYVLVVEMRLLGLFFRSYRSRLGWLD